MRVLEKLLDMELRTVKYSAKTNIILGIIFSSILILLFLGLENKDLVCVYAGCLVFWERFLIIKINELKNNQQTS